MSHTGSEAVALVRPLAMAGAAQAFDFGRHRPIGDEPIIWRNRSASEPFSRKLAKRDPINGHLGPIRWWWCRSANPSLRQIDDDRFARTARLAKLAGSRSARWAQRLRDTNE